MRELDRRHLFELRPQYRRVPGMAGHDGAILVDDDRVDKPELLDRLGDLFDLPVAVRARIAQIGLERADRLELDLQIIDRPHVDDR